MTDAKAAKAASKKAMAAAGIEEKSVATRLVEMALVNYDLGISTTDIPFAVPKNGPKIVRALRGKPSLRAELGKRYFTRMRRVAPQQALADAMNTLEGFCQENDPVELAQRVAKTRADDADVLWLDLGDSTGKAVRIDADGWKVTEDVPVLFRRTALTSPLPEPVRGGKIETLWKFVHAREEDRPLVLADLVAAFYPDIPHPVMAITGEQGTAKTTASSCLVGLIDPAPALTRKVPKDAEEWVTAASASWRVAIDNIGRAGIPDWLSDSLCRAATGTGDVRRALYTDDDVHVVSFRRSVIINGIALGRMSEDLADRALSIGLEAIDGAERKEDAKLWAAWARAHPALLGALCELVSKVMKNITGTKLGEFRPRMIDFARILATVDGINKTQGLARYASMRERIDVELVGSDVFIEALAEELGPTKTVRVSAAAILKRLNGHHNPFEDGGKIKPGWPRTPQGVGTKLTYMAPALRRAGWLVESEWDTHKKAQMWSLSVSKPGQKGTS
jgi:hypothetical protein